MMRPEGGTSNPNSHSLSATEPSDDSPASQFFAQTSLAQQRVQSFLDSTTPFVSRRWGLTSFLLLLFVLRIVFSQAWYIVCYALFIYLLNLFLAFLQPKFDPGLQADLAELDVEEGEPGLPTSNSNGASYGKMNGGANGGGGGGGLMSGMFGNDTLTGNGNGQGDEEFRPFIRRLPEFKFWLSATQAIAISLVCTLSDIFDVPVYWPILLMYFCILFAITMRRQIRHMIKYKYVPFDLGRKATYGGGK